MTDANAPEPATRRAIPKRLRFEILRRDNHACRYCGAVAPDVKLTVDHVIPVVLGGSDDPSNLVTACADCNAGKSSASPDAPIVADVAQDALRFKAALLRVEAMSLDENEKRMAFRQMFHDLWNRWTYGAGWEDGKQVRKCFDLPPAWGIAIDKYAMFGFSREDIERAIDTTMTMRNVKDEFAYTLGVLNKFRAARVEAARDLMATDDAPEWTI